jgi:hypothetical protein
MIQVKVTQQGTKQAIRATAIVIAVALHALSTSAQTAKDVKGATPLVARRRWRGDRQRRR